MSSINVCDVKGAIFDMDGVLLDSMPMWDHAGQRYLAELGIQAEDGLNKVLFTKTMKEGALYIRDTYKLPMTPDEVLSGINDYIRRFYAESVSLKADVAVFLKLLKKNDIPVTVATATDRCHVLAALKRLDVLKYIDRVFTCSEVGESKTKPKIFLEAAEYMGSDISCTYVFEDGYHAAHTAKQAGFRVVGIYDESSADKQQELYADSDYYYRDFSELLANINPIRNTLIPVLSIAGSDSSGGAGIQADIKTMQANGVYAMTAITALTAQNTTGVTSIMNASPEFLKCEIDAVFTDIRPKAVKIGMVSEEALIDAICDKLTEYGAENVVVDPVMVATSGAKLIRDGAVTMLTQKLFPLATVITPNIPEAETLAGMRIVSKEDMERAGIMIYDRYRCAVLVKGGHSINDSSDMLYDGQDIRWFSSLRIDNSNTHGTGCTLSSAIASNLAKGYCLADSVQLAKDYISGALGAMLDLGKGSGPLNHGFDLTSRYML
ncbi:MAG: bifunctional hydroxymethylpyrimidine kinase/phosphomethylpyrimidine kinase [Coprococcus sp.]|nr:bifunctional hydroxymethylpyrimidine kinase/phosphomethylpyrimidine kinase [Coprococcus sp.]